MAAVAKLNAIFLSPVGESMIDGGYAVVDMEAGDPVLIDSTPSTARQYDMRLKKATGTECHGFNLTDVKAGGYCEFSNVGEMDGFIGLTPGASLTIVGGALDDTPDVGKAQIRAVNTSRIKFVLV